MALKSYKGRVLQILSSLKERNTDYHNIFIRIKAHGCALYFFLCGRISCFQTNNALRHIRFVEQQSVEVSALSKDTQHNGIGIIDR